jgi:hypothetical protein
MSVQDFDHAAHYATPPSQNIKRFVAKRGYQSYRIESPLATGPTGGIELPEDEPPPPPVVDPSDSVDCCSSGIVVGTGI